ncbi:hypothetical protein [Shewanella baltica]|uniref:hypothetical protein n=1 Tax=Shewanella baltica TaxID=62322 RepID=UPI00217E6585|nr:hypothetical protein [Shewanella baltica]MCS6208972.1 hypothetical protein [Shewanella baltica]
MEEKYGAIWVGVEEDGSANIVFERHFPSMQKLHVIYRQANGRFLPYSFSPQNDHQWRLPIWSQENDKAIMPTLESAKEYLKHYAASNT